MNTWLQIWTLVFHGLFGQALPFPGPGGVAIASPIPTSGLLVWWDTSYGNNCSGVACTNGASQNSWADESGNGNTGTLTPAVTSPCVASVFNTNQINGLPAITFIGNNTVGSETCFSVGNNGTGLNNKTATTMFAVAKLTSTSAINTLAGGTNGSFDWRANTSKMQEGLKSCVSSLGTSTSAVNTSWHQLNVTYNATTIAFRTDRAADGSASASATITANWLVLGANFCGGGIEAYNGQLAEYILYNRVLSGGEITTVETYLNGKYGL
jgi:hypothetical protein